MPPLNRFENKRPTPKVKKDLLILTFISLFILSSVYIFTYLVYNPVNQSSIPKLNILCDDEPNFENYSACEFKLDENTESINENYLKAKIKVRGSGTSGGVNRWPKKGYRLELDQASSLLGMRKDDDWLLLAMYLDFPKVRIKLCMDLWRSLEPINPTAILPDSEYVILYFNSEYQGLYLLTEKNDRRLFGLDDAQNNINSSLIIQGIHPDFFRNYHDYNFEQDWPNEDDGIFLMDEILTELYSFVNEEPDDIFFDPKFGIFSKFDRQNLIDFYVFNFFILHGDFWNKNYFIIRNTYPDKFFLIPWDFDRALGQYAWRRDAFDTNHEEFAGRNNEIFRRLIGNDAFMQMCKDRWFELKQEIWTEEFIFDMLDENYEEVKDLLEIEARMWNPAIFRKRWNYNVEESVDDLYQWLSERIEFCDSYFDNKCSL